MKRRYKHKRFEKKTHKHKEIEWKLVSYVVLSVILFVILHYVFESAKVATLLTVVAMSVLFFIDKLLGVKNACPRCRKEWARQYRYRKIVKRWREWKEEIRTAPISIDENRMEGTVKIPVMTPFTVTRYKNYFSCENCGYWWSTISEERRRPEKV